MATVDQITPNTSQLVTPVGKDVPSGVHRNVESSVKKAADENFVKETALREINDGSILEKISGLEISISIDDEKLPPVVRIFDKQSGSELVQIPTETSIAIKKSVDALIGLVFDKKA